VKVPSAELAIRIATEVTGHTPTRTRRFTTGARHFVFEVQFADPPPIVVRIGSQAAQAEMVGAVHLSGLLKPLGVPLPAILAEDVRAELPWLALERLPGTDLGAVIATLSDEQLEQIAAEVASVQAITGKTGSAGRYGYAAVPQQAPYAAWTQVLEANLDRSRKRIAAAGLFDVALVDSVQAVLRANCHQIDQIEPTPFLHDTTTKNVIVTSTGRLSGIVDVDDLCYGDPRYPAALTLAALMADAGPVQYVSAWLWHAEQPDDPTFRLYVSLFLLDLMAEHGQMFNGNERPSPGGSDLASASVRKQSSARPGIRKRRVCPSGGSLVGGVTQTGAPDRFARARATPSGIYSSHVTHVDGSAKAHIYGRD
jgi:aminoglycoside phosphotransferase